MKVNIASKCLALAAALALVMTACSSDNDEPLLRQDARIPVVFATTEVSAVTRANEEKINTAQMLAQAGGFGVFAYYSDGSGTTDGAYNSSSAVPNFMYNQQVTGTDAFSPVWSYSPLKYWPNEIGATAKSDHVDKLTFFAYAPYIDASAVTTENITGFSASTDAGDPWLTYSSPKSVPGYDVVYAKVIDKVKPDITEEVTLTFNHALASLSYEITKASSLDLQKIEVFGWKTVGLTIAGKLNLNTGVWSELTAKKDKTEVVFEKTADPLPATGGDWKVIPGADQQFFVRITYKDGGGNMIALPELPFKETFEAGKNKVLQINIP